MAATMTCWAYTDRGAICGVHATIVAPQRGFTICLDHIIIREFAIGVREALRAVYGDAETLQQVAMVNRIQTLGGLTDFITRTLADPHLTPKAVQLGALWLAMNGCGAWTMQQYLDYLPLLVRCYAFIRGMVGQPEEEMGGA